MKKRSTLCHFLLWGEENTGREQVVKPGLRITFFYYQKTIFRKNTGTKIQLKDTLTADMPHIGR